MRKLIIWLQVVALAFFACNSQLDDKKLLLTAKIDSLGQLYSQNFVWNYQITDKEGNLVIHLETDLSSGFNQLKDEINENFPGVELQAKLLSKSKSKEAVYGIINISTGNIRKAPKHWAELVTQEVMGTPVKVLKTEDGWLLVKTPSGYEGWIDSPGVSIRTEDQMKTLPGHSFIVYELNYGQIYKTVSKQETISDLTLGSTLLMTGKTGNYFSVQLPDGRTGFVEKDGFKDFKSLFNVKKIDTVQMVKMAKTLVGVSYLWGGKSSKAIDCSGLTSLLYFFQGIILQRDASQQVKNGELISDALKVKNLKTGDLLFFGKHATDSLPERASHVAFYIGNGKIIHASGMVKISSLYKDQPDFETRYFNAFLKARRIINSVGQPGIQRINDNELYKFYIK